MAEAYRRVILKPSGLSAGDSAQLAEKLAAAVEWQQELAAGSPHVLQFTSGLQEDEAAFFVEHEPAKATIPAGTLFDPASPTLDAKGLQRMAAALFDALRVAYAPTGRQLKAHGGLCPGVIVTSPDGIDKVTDFGFAPGVCAALGVENYLNLAVGQATDSTPPLQGTGVWEVLAADVFDREDRICSFIDPEKYGAGTQEAFEPGSDIIAAGFILHLLAEHRHPYLPDPDAHRMVEMSEFMAMARYNGARRKDLRESADPGVVLWCKLVGETLARLPENRPKAEELGTALGQYVKPVDAGEILRRRLESAGELREQKAWQELRNAVKAIAGNRAAPPDVAERAEALLREANANLLLEGAIDVLKGESWFDAKGPLDEVLALPALPAEVSQRAQKASGVLEHNLALQRELETVRTRVEQDEGSDITATRGLLESSIARLDELEADKSLLSPVQGHRAELRAESAGRLEGVLAEIERIEAKRREEAERLERERQAARAKVEAWLGDLRSARDGGEWERLQQMLSEPPDLQHGPADAEKQAAEFRDQLEKHVAEQKLLVAIEADRQKAVAWIQPARDAVQAEAWDQAEQVLADKPELTHWPDDVLAEARKLSEHVAEQRRLVLIRADHEKANAWIQPVREAVEAEAWDQAEQALADKPPITHWPDDVLAEVRELTERVEDVRRQQADYEEARKWCAELGTAVEDKKWIRAADVLAARPALKHWPPDALEQEPRYREEVEKQLEAIELERRQIASWLKAATDAGQAERWVEALRTLDSPPVGLDRLPDEARAQSESLKQTCIAKREEELRRRREQRTQAVHAAAEQFVRGAVAESLKSFLDPALVLTTVDSEEFTDPESFAEGTAQLSCVLGGVAETPENGAFGRRFAFRIEGEVLRIRDDDGELKADLISHLTKRVTKLQKTRMVDLAAPLRKGAFPKIQVAVKLSALTERIQATFCLLGSDVAEAKVPSELAWDAAALVWRHSDAAGFAQRVLGLAAKEALQTFEAKLLKESAELRRYESALSFEVVPAKLPDPTVLPGALPLEGRLMIQPGGEGEPKLLHVCPLACSEVGQVSPEAEAAAAAANLRQMVVAAQNDSRGGLQSELQRRIDTASAKVKLKVFPKRLTDPVDEARFELNRRRGEPVTLTAKWDVDRFAFAAGNGWQEDLERALAPPAPGERPSRGFVPVAGAAAVILLAAVVAYVGWWRGDRGDQGDRVAEVDNTNGTVIEPAGQVNENQEEESTPEVEVSNDNAQETQVETDDVQPNANQAPIDADTEPVTQDDNDNVSAPPVRSTDQAVAEVRQLLRRCAPLEPYTAQLVSVSDDASTERSVLAYRLPGLENPERVVELVAGDDHEVWRLSEADRQEMEAGVAALDDLLRAGPEGTDVVSSITQATAAALDQVGYGRFVNVANLESRFETPGQWELSDSMESWSARGVEGQLVVPGVAEPLATFELGLELGDGVVRLGGEDDIPSLAEALRAQVEERVLQRQNDSLRQRRDELQENLGTFAETSSPTGPLAEPRETIELTVRVPRLKPRTFAGTWSRDELSFNLDEAEGKAWTVRAGELVLVHDVIELLNQSVNEDNWLGRGSNGPVTELREPDERGTWLLTTPAPWADSQEPAEAATQNSLPISVAVGSLAGRDARTLARFVLEDSQPQYWPLIERCLTYTSDTSDTFLLAYDAEREDFVRALGDAGGSAEGAIAYLRGEPAPRYILPQLEIAGKPVLGRGAENGLPDSVQIPFSGRWGLAETPEGVSGESIANAVADLMEPQICTLTLGLSAGGRIISFWTPNDEFLAGLEAGAINVAELEHQLGQLPARAAVEARLEGTLGGAGEAELSGREDEVLGLLAGIWEVKGAAPTQGRTLTQVTSQLRSRIARSPKAVPRKLKPTVLAEYFCGPTTCYAVVWSAGVDDPLSIREGPKLVSLCPTSNLGGDLIRRVLDAVPVAGNAGDLAFGDQLGVVLAVDEPMTGVNLPALSFNQVNTSLAPIETAAGQTIAWDWDQLEDLRTDRNLTGLRCDYWIVKALSAPRSSWAPAGAGPDAEARRWATRTLAAASELGD